MELATPLRVEVDDMTSLLVILYGFLGIFLAITGYCVVAAVGDVAESHAEFPLSDPTPVG
jgi:hypothetical protein